MANVTVSISTAKLHFAIAYIEGMKQVNAKVTDVVIDKALKDLGYTPVEIYLICSTPTTSTVESIFNPPIHHRSKAARKPKTEVVSTVSDEETMEDDNELGI